MDLLAAVPGNANPIVAQGAVGRWDLVYDLTPEATRSEVAQVLGNTILLYRARAEDPRISLP